MITLRNVPGSIKYKTLAELITEGKDAAFIYPCGRNREQIEGVRVCPCGINPLRPTCFMFLFCEMYYITYSDIDPKKVMPFKRWFPSVYGRKTSNDGNEDITELPEHLK